jgi:hypothetical protein
LAVLLIGLVRSSFNIDSWLELAAGREVWQGGIPHHNMLTVVAHGAQWIDQQWLAQLMSYALFRIGGLGLVGVINVALIMSGLGGAVWGARRLGADYKSILMVLPLVLFLVIPAREVRTQSFAIPLFVATAYLLASDSRNPSRRVYWCLPILIVWANLHGTVSFGVGLVALRGISLAWEDRAGLRASWRHWVRPLLLVVGAPLCLLVTPYGIDIVSYYHATLGNGELKRAVTEWQPITSDVSLAIPFSVHVGLSAWSLLRRPRQTTLWEKVALIALAAATADALRAALLFALLALMVVPVSLNGLLGKSRRREEGDRGRLNALLAAAVLAALLITAASSVARPASYFDGGAGGQRVLNAVHAALRVDPRLTVMADMDFADWLLWKDPALRGRVVTDARFELLRAAQLESLVRFVKATRNWKQAASGARLIVLDSDSEPATVRRFLAEPGRHVLYKDRHSVVILRSRQEAGQ